MNHAISPLQGRPEALRAGPLQLLYEPASGFLRRIRLGDQEILRGIYAAVRNHNWDTVPGTVVETRREILEDSFRIDFECQHRQGEIDFAWRGTLTGTAEALVRYSFEGEARSTFRRNRIGFCILHPIRECAGAPARQMRVDGTSVACRFPDVIEPQIPGQGSFRDLRGVAHEVQPGVWAEVTLEGDVFEMEDQRNWTDASFKTYCTPLTLPFPVEIPAGTRLRQCVTLRLEGWERERPDPVVEVRRPHSVRIQAAPACGGPLPMPRLGLGLASHGQPLTPPQIQRLRALALSHLRVDLRLASPDWPQLWQRAAREATQLDVNLELALHLPRDGHLDGSLLRQHLADSRGRLARILALREGEAATTRETLAAVRHTLDGWGIPVGAGSDANFCELNREHALGRCVPAEADFVFWSINPQVHAFDDTSVMETLEAQAATVKSARVLAAGRPLVVSPVTLRQRFNPVATGPEAPPPPGELPRQVDPRQAGLFGAAWTLGSLVELASAGVEAITYYETTGWRGVLERDEGSSIPAKFPSVPGGVFPLYHVFAETAAFAGGEILPVTSTAPRSMAALALRRDSHRMLLVANLDARTQIVDLEDFPDLPSIRTLAIDTLETSVRDPERYRSSLRRRSKSTVELPAFGLASLLAHP